MIPRCAGVLIPLFSIRSRRDLGRGEIGGLVPMADLALAMGHRLIQLLPIDEVESGQTSPYSALSIFAIDPIYLTLEGLPGIPSAEIAKLKLKFRIGTRVDQVALRTAKNALLSKSWSFFEAHRDKQLLREFEEFSATHSEWLEDYALYRALKHKFNGAGWEKWQPPLREHDPDAIAQATKNEADALRKFKYFQFLAHRQWRETRDTLRERGVLVGGDLAFSPSRESAEVWANQDLFDLSRSVGAPPDAFSAEGQRWGLPMPNWKRMRSHGFALIRERVRHARDLFDVLRIDHVVGLFRTYGYPATGNEPGKFDPSSTAAQRAQGLEIMRVILEAAAPMQIIAEDLGVIPQFVREVLASLEIPGYKVFRWEKENPGAANESVMPPARYPVVSLATTGTHDTETLCEWWLNAGPEERRDVIKALRLRDVADPNQNGLSGPALDEILEAVYSSPSELVDTPIQDLFGWTDRINFPGTITADNWSWRLPFDVEQWRDDAVFAERVNRLRKLCERVGRTSPESDPSR
jgi:4-alpha-glucanotransferase